MKGELKRCLGKPKLRLQAVYDTIIAMYRVITAPFYMRLNMAHTAHTGIVQSSFCSTQNSVRIQTWNSLGLPTLARFYVSKP